MSNIFHSLWDRYTKHRGSKKGYRPVPGESRRRRKAVLTNHQRVMLGRAWRLGISLQEYKRKFCEGGTL